MNIYVKYILRLFLIVMVSGIVVHVASKTLPAEKVYISNITQEEEHHIMVGVVHKFSYQIVCDRTIGDETEKQIPLELDSGDYEQVKELGYYLIGGWTRVLWMVTILDLLFMMLVLILFIREKISNEI